MAGKAVRKAKDSRRGSHVVRQISLSRRFNLVFCTTALITVASISCAVILAFRGGDSAITKDVANGCLAIGQIGVGAIVGLLGGKAL